MSGAFLVIAPIAVIALLLVLKSVRDVSRSIKKLVESTQELRDVGVGLSKIRDDLAAMRAPNDEPPPQ